MRKLLRLVPTAVLALAAFPASAGAVTVGTLPPVTTQVVDNGPGNQTDPHVSGDLVSYTSEEGGTINTEIRHHNLATGAAAAIPNLGAMDFLSDVSGGRIVFTRVNGEESAVYVYEVGSGGAPVEVAPEPGPSSRRAPAIGGQTVAFQDFTFTGNPLEPEVVVHDLATGISTRLTNNALLERDIAVSPDGSVVAFTQCNTTGTSCDVVKATRSGAAWTTAAITGGAGEEGTADTNGALIAYSSTRSGQTDIYFQSVAAGGAEKQIALAGEQANPNVSGTLISFDRARFASPGGPREIHVYDTATDTLYLVTNTGVTNTVNEETLSDISVSMSGSVRIVYQVIEEEAGNFNFNVYASSFTLRTPARLIADLVEKTLRFAGHPPLGAVLRAKLERVADAVVQGNKPLACALLNGYIAAVNLAPTSVLSPAEKAELRSDANRIKAVLAC